MAPTIRTPVGDAPIIPITVMLIGGYIAWFGVHYFKSDQKWPTDPLKSVLSGNGVQPATYNTENQRNAANASYVSSVINPSAATGVGTTSTNSIAAAALKYVGQGYVWGGNADKPGNWDCSSFVSYVLGHDLNLPLPGGVWGEPGFPPSTHGPTTVSYALYGTPINAPDVQAGDLVVWPTHMGIATDNSHIVSARDPQDGVGVNTIAEMSASLGTEIHYRRVVTGTGVSIKDKTAS